MNKTQRRVASEKEKDIQSKAKPKPRELLLQDIDPSSYRNSIFHNICTEMLEKGFHQSFTQLFELIRRQRCDHEKAGPASILLEPLIEHNHAKLEYLRVQLTVAEDAERANDLDTVYMAQRNLAQYFEHTDDAKRTKDKWLSDYFYDQCLETGSMVKGDNRRKEGEAHCHVGLALENRGDLAKASFHMEIFHELASKHKWHTESGDSLHEIACEHLRRMFTSIAEEVHSEDPNLSITYLKKANEIAREGGDSYQEGKSSYRLGNALERIGRSESAISYHKQYLEQCKYHSDQVGVCRAYEALAKSFESKGDISSAAKFLEMFVSVAEGAGLQDSLADACSAIGTMCNTMGDYDKAVQYFGRCYEICSHMDNAAALYSARVQYGIARGHHFMGNFSALVTKPPPHGLQNLVAWKDARVISTEPGVEGEGEGEGEEAEESGGEEEERGAEVQGERDQHEGIATPTSATASAGTGSVFVHDENAEQLKGTATLDT